ncbi:MAG: glycosyltransferase family 39 protein [Patescibacteria group bacterium]
MTTKNQYHFYVLSGLIIILALAFLFRTYQIDSIPAGLYPDEATNATDALNAIQTGNYLAFYPNNYGREGFFINLQAFAIKTFGYNVAALKLWSAVFGTLAVLGAYLLATELFKRRSAGLIAAFIAATSFWAINFSRIGFRAIMLPFLVSFTFYFFFRGIRTRRFLDFAISGGLLGLGLHTYIAARLTPLILILLLPFLMLSYEKFLKRYWKHALVFLAGAFIVSVPMLYHFFVSHPEDFASRTGAVSIFSPEINKGDFWGTLGKTVSLSLLKYNFWGDQNWRHNYPPYPILDPIVGAFFLAGFLFVLWQSLVLLVRRIKNKDRDTRLVTNAFLLSAFLVMLMPEFLTEEGLPHALRAIGTQTPVFLLATLPAFWIWKKARRSQPGTRFALISLLVILLFASATINLSKYFIFFAQSPHQHGAFNENYTNMSKYLIALPPETHKYVLANAGGTQIDNGLPVTAQPLLFLTAGRITNLEFLTPETALKRPAVILLMKPDDALTERILQKAPDARVETIDPHPGLGGDFKTIILP